MVKQWKYTVSKNGRHQISQIGGGNICMVWNCREKESNAHLIAAAPEMYEMLENLSLFLSEDGVSTNGLAKELANIRRLLEKARGEK